MYACFVLRGLSNNEHNCNYMFQKEVKKIRAPTHLPDAWHAQVILTLIWSEWKNLRTHALD
jgi:hypothetical protein